MTDLKINHDLKTKSANVYKHSLFKKSFYENYKAYINTLKQKNESTLSDRIFDINIINQNIKKASSFSA